MLFWLVLCLYHKYENLQKIFSIMKKESLLSSKIPFLHTWRLHFVNIQGLWPLPLYTEDNFKYLTFSLFRKKAESTCMSFITITQDSHWYLRNRKHVQYHLKLCGHRPRDSRGGRACIARGLPVRWTNEARDETEMKPRRKRGQMTANSCPKLPLFCVIVVFYCLVSLMRSSGNHKNRTGGGKHNKNMWRLPS